MKTCRFERLPSNPRVLLVLAALLCATGTPSRAAAEETVPKQGGAVNEAVRAEAREAFRKGTELAKNARWDEALSNFERSYALHAHPITSYNIAYCERAVGHYTRAYSVFMRARREHSSGEAGTLPANLLTSTEQHIEQITERVARVRLSVKPAGARLLVDGRPLEAAEGADGAKLLLSGTREAGPAERVPEDAEVWLDPGSHVFVISHEDADDNVVTRRFSPGARETLELAAKAKSVVTIRTDPVKSERSTSLDPKWKFVAYGVGAAGIVAGGVAGVAALRKRSELVDECGPDRNQCPPESQGGIDSMKRFADASTVGFVVGAVGISVGTLLWIFGGKSGDEPPRTGLSIGAGSARLAGEF
jgi:hypothetical protein